MIVQFATLEGENKGPQIDVPLGSTVLQMEELMNQLLENKNKVQTEAVPCISKVPGTQIARVRQQVFPLRRLEVTCGG